MFFSYDAFSINNITIKIKTFSKQTIASLEGSLEKMVSDQLTTIPTCQSGFRQNQTTVSPLLDVTETLRNSLDSSGIGFHKSLRSKRILLKLNDSFGISSS